MSEKITLISSDDQKFEVSLELLHDSKTINELLENLGDAAQDQPIPLPAVTSKIVQKIIEYYEYHHNLHLHERVEVQLRISQQHRFGEWDLQFFRMDQETLYELVMAADYLGMESLLNEACQAVANLIKGKSTEEMRRIYNIENDFTREEEEAIRKENAWCEI